MKAHWNTFWIEKKVRACSMIVLIYHKSNNKENIAQNLIDKLKLSFENY